MADIDFFQQEEIDRLRNGDLAMFRLVFNRELPLLLAFAEKFIDHSSAQDLIQDVFLKIWSNRETFPINQSIRAYLFQAVRNRCINHLEHLKAKGTMETGLLIEEQIREAYFFRSPEQLFIEKEQLNTIFLAIEKLPEKSKEVFKLAYFENQKAAQIAEQLNLSVRTVETHIYKALKTLKAMLLN